MFSTLFPEVSKTIGAKIIEELTGPFIFFWALNLCIFGYLFGVMPIQRAIAKVSQTSDPEKGIIIFLLFLAYILFERIVKGMGMIMLVFLSGKKPPFFFKMWYRLFYNRKSNTIAKLEARYQELQNKKDSMIDLTQLEYNELDYLIRKLEFTPIVGCTEVGNILHHIGLRQLLWYGMDAATCWQRLWLLMPENVKTELSKNSERIESYLSAMVLSLLFLLYKNICVTVAVAVVLGYLYYKLLVQLRCHYTLVSSAFDCFRFLLYDLFKIPIPSTRAEEIICGETITSLIRSGESATSGLVGPR